MKEDIVSFIKSNDNDLPFFVSMCGISYCDGSYKIKRTDSDTNVMEYILSGCGTVQQDKTTFTAKSGDIYYLKKGRDQLYYSDPNNPWIKMWINFEGDLADKITQCYGLTEKLHFHAPELKNYFIKMINISKSNIGAKAISEKIAIVFLKIIQKIADAENKKPISESIGEKIKSYIDNINDYNINLEEISKYVYCSKSHAIREFRSKYGITPYEYILRKKFYAAKAMLKNTSLQIGDISEKTGFCDSHYFSYCFSKRFGISPSDYRKNFKK